MPDSQDIIKSDPIGTLNKASNINLAGGGAMFAVAVYFVYKMNDSQDKWTVDLWVILALIVGAVTMGVASAIARMFDAQLRAQLALSLINTKGTSNVVEADKKSVSTVQVITFEQLKEIMGGSMGAYFMQPPTDGEKTKD